MFPLLDTLNEELLAAELERIGVVITSHPSVNGNGDPVVETWERDASALQRYTAEEAREILEAPLWYPDYTVAAAKESLAVIPMTKVVRSEDGAEVSASTRPTHD